MSCNCKKNKLKRNNLEEKRSKERPPEVSQEDFLTRKAICRDCEFSTKRTTNESVSLSDPLGPLSKCKKNDKMLLHVLSRPDYSCPENKFEKADPKIRL